MCCMDTLPSLFFCSVGAIPNAMPLLHPYITHLVVFCRSYNYLRHPSYVGFYYWSIGTQLLLGNPISFVCYAIASWLFFRRRMPYEEETLVRYFPDEYPTYVARTWSGLPFIWSDVGKIDDDSGNADHEQISFSADGFKKLS
mmetsp:Transcript_5668/g.10749  ORF Transcript_5668/g.10749 Transcript_5668/m.10749 type:complete len:142 (-) Transcript_5668:212-637(-)